MKVLHILDELKYSGGEIMLRSAANKFSSAGIETVILSTGKIEGEFAKYYRELGWTILHLPFKKKPQFFLRYAKIIKNEKFDVIHIHNEQAFFWITSATCLWAGKVKIVRTVHAHFTFSGYLKLRRQLHQFLASKVFNVKFISISEAVQKNEKENYYTNTFKINNWIDTERFGKRNGSTVSIDQNRINIVSVGSCSTVKNHTAILHLIKTLVERNIDCHYWHIGCGELEGEERDWTEKNGLQDHVSFLGNRNDVEKYLVCNYFFLMPSLFEGLGNACLEAMSAGMCCFVHNAPALNSIIKHNETGFITDFKDAEATAKLLLSVWNNNDLKEKVKRNASEYVKEHFGLSNIDKMIKLYV